MYTYACTPEKRYVFIHILYTYTFTTSKYIYAFTTSDFEMRWSPNLTPKKVLNGVNNIKLYELCSQYRASIVILICRCLR